MSRMRIIFDALNSDQAVKIGGFAFGFIHRLKFNSKTLDRPLSTIFGAAWEGFWCGLGAIMVSDFLPKKLRCVIPLIALISCLYYKVKDYKDFKKIESSPNPSVEPN